MSVELTTSAESAPIAWPSCMPKIAPPMFWIIEEAPPIMDFISSGICSVMAAESALAMLLATGSVSRFQVPRVSSTHSARDHARPISPVAGSPVTWSSHSSASRRASSTSRDCCAVTEGSDPLAATRRAFSCASCQLTGPSEGALIIACTWENIWARRFGSSGRPAAFASSAGSIFPMPWPPIRFFSISASGSLGSSSPLDGLSGLEVMIPPIVGVAASHVHGTPRASGLSAETPPRSL